MNVVVGNRLKILRKTKNWSQEQVADYLHISQSAYARIERGEGNSWSNYIRKFCELYKINPEELIKEEVELDDSDNISMKEGSPENLFSKSMEERFDSRLKELKKIIKFLKHNKDKE